MTPTLARSLIERCRRDPVFFCTHILGVRPWQKQAEVLTALRDHDRVAVRSGHGTGKTFIAASAAIWFLYSYYPAKVITTAPTWSQVRNILWQEIRRQVQAAHLPAGGKLLEEQIKLGAGAFAVGLSTDEPERFQGYHAEHILVVLDEAPGVRNEVWEAAETLMTSRCSRMLAIGNPTRPSGPFYQAFAPDSNWQQVHISCIDSPNLAGNSHTYAALVTEKWIAEKRLRWGEHTPLFQARVLGEFPDDGDGALIPRGAVAKAIRQAQVNYPDHATLCLGVDVARTGTDATVMILRDRYGLRHLESHHNESTMQTVGRIVRLMEKHGLTGEEVFIDDTGIGAGVTDRLRELGHEVNAVVLGSRANDGEHFANVRAESYWRLREALMDEETPFRLPDDSELARELTELRYSLTSSGAIILESKDELHKRLGRSPDRADALALTFARGAENFNPVISVI